MTNDIIQKNVSLLSRLSEDERHIIPCSEVTLPSVAHVREIITLLKCILFPGFFDKFRNSEELRSYHIGVHMEQLLQLLREQISLALHFASDGCDCQADVKSQTLSEQLIDRLPSIKEMLFTDVEAIYHNDPSTRNYGEVIFCYPIIEAMLHYRSAHELYQLGVPILPRIITEMAHSSTGIDIHPGARIGRYFSIDHGTGVVIGETSIIGDHVTLYQGVTLGAPSLGGAQHEKSSAVPRHPILEDHVTVYSNSTLLGRITIGHHTVIGGNVWLTHSVMPHSHILQSKAQDVSFTDGAGI